MRQVVRLCGCGRPKRGSCCAGDCHRVRKLSWGLEFFQFVLDVTLAYYSRYPKVNNEWRKCYLSQIVVESERNQDASLTSKMCSSTTDSTWGTQHGKEKGVFGQENPQSRQSSPFVHEDDDVRDGPGGEDPSRGVVPR